MGIFDGVLLACDVDGTLLNSRSELTPAVSGALASFTARGGRFTVATGRSYLGFETLRPSLPLSAPAILSNGAYIYDYDKGEALRARWLGGPFEAALTDILDAFPTVGTELHWPDKVAIMNYNRWNEQHMRSVRCVPRMIATPADTPPPWRKALFVDDNKVLTAIRDFAVPRWGKDFSFFFSAENLLEMQNTGVDKAEGIAFLVKALGLDPKHAYAAGDAGNDLGMLRAYPSFAMRSGTPEARAAATYTVPSCDADGLVDAVRILEGIYG
ncbi:MAG: HAD family hydrolase [Oscillospiraceae bacterium]|nr:HAD family hydrolase [Oscillospiraceae bacterium]